MKSFNSFEFFVSYFIYFNCIKGFAELSSQNKLPQRTRPSIHEPGLHFTLVNGVIRPQVRLAGIRKIRANGYIIGIDDRGIFKPIFKDGIPVEVLETNSFITRPLNRQGVHYLQYRSLVHPSP